VSETVGTDAAGLRAAVRAVRAGRVLLYPTETVYGLGGHAGRDDVLQRVRALKGRDADKPVLVLTDTWRRVADWVVDPDDTLRRIMSHEPPPPVTLLMAANDRAPSGVVGPEGLIGIRRTADAFCRALVAASDAPLLSTSANRSGQPAAADLGEVEDAILAGVDLVVDAGRRLPGVPSTVARVVDGAVHILRAGAVDAATLERVAAGGR
jgi:L-threonylcarbamoyladenylate synthase